MQATYCDLCGKKIRNKITRKEMPVMYTSGAHWSETDMCEDCVQKVAEFCSKLKGEEQ